MKKVFLSLLLVVLVSGLTFGAPPKKAKVADEKGSISLFFDAGIAFSDFEGLFLEAGGQYAFTPKIFGEFLFDFYLNPAGESGEGVSSKAYGFNFNAVYKHPLSRGLNLFGKAGINLTITSVSFSFWGQDFSESDSNFGLNFGGGVEYGVSEQMAIRGGLTFKIAFAEGETGTWFKLYGGVSYKLK